MTSSDLNLDYLPALIFHQVVWATSELHLMELFEKICNTMTNYAEMTDETTGHKTIIRTSSYDGTPVSLKNIKMSGERTSSLKFAVGIHSLFSPQPDGQGLYIDICLCTRTYVCPSLHLSVCPWPAISQRSMCMVSHTPNSSNMRIMHAI